MFGISPDVSNPLVSLLLADSACHNNNALCSLPHVTLTWCLISQHSHNSTVQFMIYLIICIHLQNMNHILSAHRTICAAKLWMSWFLRTDAPMMRKILPRYFIHMICSSMWHLQNAKWIGKLLLVDLSKQIAHNIKDQSVGFWPVGADCFDNSLLMGFLVKHGALIIMTYLVLCSFEHFVLCYFPGEPTISYHGKVVLFGWQLHDIYKLPWQQA